MSIDTVARLKEGWRAESREWKRLNPKAIQAVYLWVDGVYFKSGQEKEKGRLFVVIAGLLGSRKLAIAAKPGYCDSTAT